MQKKDCFRLQGEKPRSVAVGEQAFHPPTGRRKREIAWATTVRDDAVNSVEGPLKNIRQQRL